MDEVVEAVEVVEQGEVEIGLAEIGLAEIGLASAVRTFAAAAAEAFVAE